jgi:hypothetical protein
LFGGLLVGLLGGLSLPPLLPGPLRQEEQAANVKSVSEIMP